MQRSVLLFASVLLWIGPAAHASDDASAAATPVEVRPFVGAYLPTGTQKNELKDSVLGGAQVGYALPIPLQLVGTFGWSPSRAKDFSNARTSIYQYDTGLEFPRRLATGGSWRLSPFVGAGVGARSYSLKKFSTSSQTDLDGYGSLGGEVSASRLGARLEFRDYVSRFKGIDGRERNSTRNDVMLVGAMTLRI